MVYTTFATVIHCRGGVYPRPTAIDTISLYFLYAAGRVGINPTPTEDACNALVVSVLLSWFRVVCVINLSIASVIHCRGGVYPHPRCCGVFASILARCCCRYLLCILSAVSRAGINPAPTADVCNTLAINGL